MDRLRAYIRPQFEGFILRALMKYAPVSLISYTASKAQRAFRLKQVGLTDFVIMSFAIRLIK